MAGGMKVHTSMLLHQLWTVLKVFFKSYWLSYTCLTIRDSLSVIYKHKSDSLACGELLEQEFIAENGCPILMMVIKFNILPEIEQM